MYHVFCFYCVLGMLTRLARLETRKNFSVSGTEFLAVKNLRQCNKQLDRRSTIVYDGGYVNPLAGNLRTSCESSQ